MAMELRPCDACPAFTYNGKQPSGDRLCSSCVDALLYVQRAPVDELRDLIANPIGGVQ